ncbi:DUF1861 family protein [Paenibacillus sp. CGMCC 1.16610]|uniref:DUF1861 family protein n=1 Tax=Paenibacillus anseongense TaxID=2682845 RepID=A0ABW9UAA8_9BACL|nr:MULTISPECIES: DUF1861 family protein [Paenibacillus]MBA2942521.1 DUF1861 family protein [Paenibacillus sp. CGMCC 1.16610]MVQ35335.1 DUF1861 family protein [Paenibacillus anseongense]
MTLKEQKLAFETAKKIYESATLVFHGVDGFDVYNVSIPFIRDGKRYLFGRIERREEWARSWVRLFEETGQDEWAVVKDSMIYTLEDPYVTEIGEELVMGGTHVQYERGKYSTFFGYFFRGTDLNNLYYFTTGPNKMKDIRLVPLQDGKIGVFSRPRRADMSVKYGSESMIGFTIIDRLEDLTAEVIDDAPYIYGIFGKGEWGGVNQAYLLDSGKIGVIGHICYTDKDENGGEVKVYLNMALVFDPTTRESSNLHLIGSRSCYPPGPAKMPQLVDCVFASGIAMRPDGKADLYSGIGDCHTGRITIDYPFEGYGRIV